MKKQIGNLLRVLISVGILVYLFNNIMQDETESALQPIADAPQTPPAELAARLHITPAQVELVRDRAVMLDPDTKTNQVVNIRRLSWGERKPLVWQVGPRHLRAAFANVRLGWFLLGVAFMGVVVFCTMIRWGWILAVQGLQLPFRRLLSINFIGMFFNAFMLGATGGDVMKAWYVANETHHKKAEAVATVIVDRIIGLLVLFVIALVMMALFWRRVFDDPRLRTFAIFTLLFVAGTVAVTVIGFWKGFADKFFGVRGWLQKFPKYDMLRRMVDAYRVYTSHPGVLAKTALITVVVHFCSMIAIVCIGRGLAITSATLVDYLLYLPIINSISAIPISVSGFGVREGMYVEMFKHVGVAPAAAVALSLLGYFATLIWSLVGAPFYLLHRKELPPASELANQTSST